MKDLLAKNPETTLSIADSFERVRPELLAMSKESLRPINLDIPTVVVTITGTLPEVMAMRPLIAATLGEAQAAHVDRLPMMVHAASQSHADYLIALQPTEVQSQSDALVGKREVLEADATALVRRGFIKAGELAGLRGSVGFNNQIFDVLQLVALLRKHWAAIEGRTGVTLAELDEAERAAQRFTEVLAAREKLASAVGAVADLRQRAYTMLLMTYEQVQRAIRYLRFLEDDVDDIVPSLWAGRRRSSARADSPVDAEPRVLGPAAPTPVTPAVTGPGAAPVTPVTPIAPGLPGASPFMR